MPENIPTEPGYYWHRDIDQGSGEAYEWEPLQVQRVENVLAVNEIDPVVGYEGEWGPRIPDPEEAEGLEGSSIRDDLARKVLIGLIASNEDEGGVLSAREKVFPRIDLAYKYADAMLERSKKQ